MLAAGTFEQLRQQSADFHFTMEIHTIGALTEKQVRYFKYSRRLQVDPRSTRVLKIPVFLKPNEKNRVDIYVVLTNEENLSLLMMITYQN